LTLTELSAFNHKLCWCRKGINRRERLYYKTIYRFADLRSQNLTQDG